MEVREVLVIIGVVLIAVILWDGLRRMKSKKANRYRGSYTQDPDELKKKAELSRELPNGGARVRSMTEEEKEDLSSRLNLRERVPMLMDSVEEESTANAEQPLPTAEDEIEQQSLDFDAPVQEAAESEPSKVAAEVETQWRASAEPDLVDTGFAFSAREDDEFVDEKPPRPVGDQIEDDEQGAESGPDEDESPAIAEAGADYSWPDEEPQPLERDEDDAFQIDPRPVEELVIIHVMAREGQEISGSDLLETLLRAGLRFGPLDIFHYRNPRGQLEFSLANCVQPGTLDPDTMEQMTTPGITLFMQLPLHADMMESFDHMYEMARFLSKHLGAELLDEEHSTVTPQRVEHYRERLRNFARSQLIQAHE